MNLFIEFLHLIIYLQVFYSLMTSVKDS